MSALIKSGGSAGVRSFALRDEPQASASPPVDPREAECVALRAEVDRLIRCVAEAESRSDEATLDAYEKGRRAGLTEAAVQEDERLDALRHSLEVAVNLFEARLEVLEYLAPALVRAALQKLFDAPDDWSAMSEAMLARQLRQLRRTAVVAIRVSPDDFADPGKLETLAAGGAHAQVDADLRAGACRIECKLGQIDLDIRDQWSELAKLLDTMGEAA